MNPPPLPKSEPSPAHYCAWFGLLAPIFIFILAVVLHVVFMPMPRPVMLVAGLIYLLLIPAGLITAVIGLCGIREHGARGLLGKGIAGVIFNGILIALFAVAAMNNLHRAAISRHLTQNIHNDAQEMQANARQSYNPKTGITNTDFKSLDKLQGDMDKAAKTLSGDDALISEATSHYLARMRSGMEKYHEAAAEVMAARVLVTSNLTDVAQIAARREAVQNFIAVNDDFKNIITNSEASIRADMVSLKVSPDKIDAAMAGFSAKFVPRRELDLQIRECDDRIGEGSLTILNLLEADWGHWHYNQATAKIYFDNELARQTYMSSLNDINRAARDQVKYQGKLMNLP